MNSYLATMCEFRPHEIEADRIVRHDRRWAVIGTPVLIGFIVLMMFA